MMRLRSRRQPRGFALLAVLWVMTGVAVLGATISLAARSSVAAAQNRMDMIRAGWRARGCAARARTVIESVLDAGSANEVPESSPWTMLDVLVARERSPLLDGCEVSLRPSGMTFAINSDSGPRIRALLLAAGVATDAADSMVDALLDWRDADDTPRLNGAERSWYVARQRRPPRNADIASVGELKLVRGFDRLPGIDSLFSPEYERIVVARAPLPVLATIPGLDGDALALIAERRRLNQPITDLRQRAGELSDGARLALLSNYAALAERTTNVPDAWTLTSRASAGSPPLETTVELRLAKAGKNVVVVRRRSWP